MAKKLYLRAKLCFEKSGNQIMSQRAEAKSKEKKANQYKVDHFKHKDVKSITH